LVPRLFIVCVPALRRHTVVRTPRL